ncbi:cytochrome C biogenesis protein CcsA [Campylobacter jejuni]|nr:cytochrome C biogenesis protein CcsA [Campylobacter jejuni]HEC2976337.1 cytochrome C biogenesis protein CcsA [Campylobacter jejuni]
MKVKSLLIASLVAFSSLNAASLIDEAKNSGLVALPKDQKGVDEILKQNGVKASEFTLEKAELGKKLYFEPRLSKSGIISCNTCHNVGLGGTDGISTAIGHKWTANPHHLNSPTVYNAVLNNTQFWDGRAGTLADQAKGPIQADPEMATPAKLAVEKISSLPEYVSEFKKIYGKSGVNFDNIADAIANFERTLITPSRFDKFLEGDEKALTKEEQKGLKLFIDKGCVACHNGVIWNLKDAIKEMGSVQLGIKISDKEAKSIETFLKSLTGTKPAIVYPQLPISTEKTPKPEL